MLFQNHSTRSYGTLLQFETSELGDFMNPKKDFNFLFKRKMAPNYFHQIWLDLFLSTAKLFLLSIVRAFLSIPYSIAVVLVALLLHIFESLKCILFQYLEARNVDLFIAF